MSTQLLSIALKSNNSTQSFLNLDEVSCRKYLLLLTTQCDDSIQHTQLIFNISAECNQKYTMSNRKPKCTKPNVNNYIGLSQLNCHCNHISHWCFRIERESEKFKEINVSIEMTHAI